MRKYFLRTNKRLKTECGGQPSHFLMINQFFIAYIASRREYAFPRKRVLAVAVIHDACASGNGGNGSIAAWVRKRR